MTSHVCTDKYNKIKKGIEKSIHTHIYKYVYTHTHTQIGGLGCIKMLQFGVTFTIHYVSLFSLDAKTKKATYNECLD